MEHKKLTGTGIYVTPLCLGTMTFANPVSEKDACEMVDYAISEGINFIDTADVYSAGESEKYVGKAIKGRRDKVVLATKVGYPLRPGEDDPNDNGLSRRHILKSIDESLLRLGTDYLDIYYMHCPIYSNPMEETLDALSSVVRSGKARYIGVSNQAAWQICKEAMYCGQHALVPPVLTQNTYNIITRGIEQELVPFAGEFGIGMVVYNPLAGGLLSGKHKFGAPTPNTRFDGNKMYLDRFWNEENFKAMNRLTEIAEEAGISLLELSLRWVATQTHVDSILTGATRLEQLKQNIELVRRGPLTDDILVLCDEVWEVVSGKRPKYNR